jgi:tetratricopeptide (TPR) repeat protein
MTDTSPRETRPTIEMTLARAVSAHRAGALTDAERLYLQVLAGDDSHFDALHLLGLLHSARGNLQAADRLIRAALSVISDCAEAHYNYGNVKLALRQFEDACASYAEAIALKPHYADAHCNRGIALFELRRFGEACASYDAAIALRPDHFLAYSNRGNALFELKRFHEALASHDRALAINPNYAEAHTNRGNVLMQMGDGNAALASYEKMAALRPQSADAHFNCAAALNALGRGEEAVASYDRAIALNPNRADAYANRGNVLLALSRPEAALASYEKALALQPRFAEAHYNRAIACVARGFLEEAVAGYDQAISLNPNYLEALNNRAAALVELGRHEEALASYQDLVARWPDDAGTQMNEGILRLLMGDYRRGWEKYEWRRKRGVAAEREFSPPSWSGEGDLTGKVVLLQGEQGLGDVIQFCRYAPLIAKRAAKVILAVPPSLKSLVGNVCRAADVVGFGEPRPDFDIYCPLLSLPFAFKTEIATIPADVPYISVENGLREKWQRLLPRSETAHIGVCWAGNPKHRNDHNRSIELRRLLPLLEATSAQFFSLQKELRAGDLELLRSHPRLVHLREGMENMAETAAMIAQLDLVISVDTLIAHLAGALGKPVWILLPFAPDWRWLLDRSDSPWYPTARLFRQLGRGDWSGVIDRVTAELSRWP